MELVLIIALTVLLIPVAVLTTGPLRIVVGLLFILFLTGYALVAALFPKKDSLDGIERVALSFVLSIALVALMALALNYSPWGIVFDSILVTLFAFTLVASLIALFRRLRLPKEQRFEPHLPIKLPRLGGWSKVNKALLGALLVSIVLAIGAMAYAVAVPGEEEAFTEFYIVGSEGVFEDYPQELILGEEGTVLVGIVNHENQIMLYSLEVEIDGEKVQEIVAIILHHEEKWEEPVTFVPIQAGEDQKVELLLYKRGESDPYLQLYFWLDVQEPG